MKKNAPKSVIFNFAYNLSYQMVRLILPLVTMPFVSRALGTEPLGVYNYTYSVALYFAMLAYLGFENYGNRLIAQKRDNQQELNKAFTGAYAFQVFSSVLAILCYALYVMLFCSDNQLIAWIQIIYVSSELFNISWLYFGLEQFKKTTMINISSRLIAFVGIILFVRTPDDLPIYTLLCAGPLLASSLLLWFGIRKRVSFTRVSFKEILRHGRGTIILFFPVLVFSIYQTMDKIMLGNMASMTDVALYANADKAAAMPFSVITALGVVMIPRMTNLISKGNMDQTLKYIKISMRFMLFLSCGMCFGILGIANVFAPVFFGEDFAAAGGLMMIIAPMLIVRSCANVVRTQYLLPMGRDRDYIVSILIGLGINLTFNSILIPICGAAGAAIATLMTESFVALYQIFVCRKDIPVVRYTFRNWAFLVAGIIMFVPVFFYGETHSATVATLLIQLAMGVALYALLGGGYLYFTDKEMIRSLFRRKKKTKSEN